MRSTNIRIEFDDRLDEQTAAELKEWVRASAETVTLAYGRFPAPRVRVILRPTWRSYWGGDTAVFFGRTTRAHGGTVELFIDPDRPIDEFYADWTATHEFSHLMLPLLEREHRWLSEGFATYYQNVLMARAGRYDAETAWRRLAAGFARGRESRPDLSPNAAARGARNARMKYYWAGAAFALLADAELRARSGGKESLDTVLGQLEQCCLPARRRWSAPRLLRQLDAYLATPLFMPLWRQHADSTGFPDIESVMNEAKYAAMRKAIMRTR